MSKKVKRLIIFALVLCMALPMHTFAEGGEKLLFSDDFSSLPQWSGSSAGVVGYETVQPFKTAADGKSTLFLTAKTFENLNLTYTFKTDEWSAEADASFTAFVRYIDENNNYSFTYSPSSKTAALVKTKDGVKSYLYNSEGSLEMNVETDALAASGSHSISVTAAGGVVRAEADGKVLLQGIDNDPIGGEGKIGFETYMQQIEFEAVSVKTPKVLIREDFAGGRYLGRIISSQGGESAAADGKITLLSNGSGESRYLLKGEALQQGELFANTILWVNANIHGNMLNNYMYLKTRVQTDDKCYATFQHGAKKEDGSYQPYSSISREGVGQTFQTGAGAMMDFDKDTDYYFYTKNYDTEAGGKEVVFTLGKDRMWNEYGSYWRYVDDTENAILNGGGYMIQTVGGTIDINSIRLESLEDEQTLFAADFENTAQWELENLAKGEHSGNKVYKTTAAQNGVYILGDNEWTNTETSIDVKASEWSSDENAFAAIYSRYIDENNYAAFFYYPKSQYEGQGKYTLRIVENGKTVASKDDFRTALNTGEFHRLSLGVKDGNIRGAVDGKYIIETYAFDSDKLAAKPYGSVAIRTNNQAAVFDNVKVVGENRFIYDNFDDGNPWYSVSGSGVWSGIKFSSAVNDNGVLKNNGNKLILEMFSNNKPGEGKESILYTSIKSDSWDELNIKRRCTQTAEGRTEAYDLRISYDSLIFMYDSQWSFNNVGAPIASFDCASALPDGSEHVIGFGIIDKESTVVLRAYIDGALVLETETGKIPESFKTAENEAMYDDYNSVHPMKAPDNEKIYFDLYKEVEVNDISLVDASIDEKLHSEISFDKTAAAPNETVTASYKLENNKYVPETAVLIAAVYDENMKLISLVSNPVVLHSQVDNTFNLPVTLPAEANEKWYVCAMAWKSMTDIIPIGRMTSLGNK